MHDTPHPHPSVAGGQPSERAPIHPLTARSALLGAAEAFNDYMTGRSLSAHTIKSFQYDLNILIQYLGASRAVGDIGLHDLKQFVAWLQHDRGIPCKAKSLARRITTLKVFFGWLTESGVLASDPAASLIQVQVTSPLPDILDEDQVEQLLATTSPLRQASKADARPHLLVSLLLATGIKKGECMNLALDHLDLSDPAQPMVWIRYAQPRQRLKERKLALAPGWPRILDEYLGHYSITDKLFPCTARNLEYVLADMGKRANLPRQVSFEMLRWTCAVRDFKSGLEPDKLRRKLGLSEITWHETREKITRLATGTL